MWKYYLSKLRWNDGDDVMVQKTIDWNKALKAIDKAKQAEVEEQKKQEKIDKLVKKARRKR